jgi:hypothetical protein
VLKVLLLQLMHPHLLIVQVQVRHQGHLYGQVL